MLVEKPIALETSAALKMVEAGKKSGKLLLIGPGVAVLSEYAFALKAVQSGKYGRLLGGHFKRIISDPLWIKDFYDPRTVGGPVVDLHIHDAHFIRLLCGMPQAVFSTGRMRRDVVEFFTTQFQFADQDLAVTATSGVIAQQGDRLRMGSRFTLEKATIVFRLCGRWCQPRVQIPLTVLGPGDKVTEPKLDAVDGFVAELTEVTKAIKSGKPSPILDGTLAADALVLCHKQTQSVKIGKLVKV